MRLLAALLALTLGLVANGSMQPRGAAPPGLPIDNPPQPGMALAGLIELPRLIDLISDKLAIRIEYSPEALKGTVVLRLPVTAPLTNLELWALLNDQLVAKGLTTVFRPESGIYSVVKLESAAASSPVIRGRDVEDIRSQARREPPPGYLVVQLAPTHRRAGSLAHALAAFAGKSGSGGVVQVGESELIQISDLRSRVEDALAAWTLLDRDAEPVVREFSPKFLPPSTLAGQAKEVVAKRDAFAGDKTTGDVLVLAGRPSVQIVAPFAQVEFWLGLLSRLDQAGTLVETKTYTPRAFAVKDVARLIEQVVRDVLPTGGGQWSAPSGDRAAASGAASGSQPSDNWRLVVDELTEALIITATSAQHNRIAELLERLEATPADAAQQVRVFSVRNRPVKEIAESLSQLMDTAGADLAPDGPGRSTLGVPSSAPVPSGQPSRAGPAAKSETRKLRMSVDEGANVIIAVGDPRALAQAEQLLAKLDARQPQVMVEVVLVSLSDGQSRALGVELQKFGSLNGSAVQLSSIFGSASAGGPSTTPGLGFTGAVLNPGDFNAVLRAFEAINDGRSTSIPRVLVGNNQDATFNSVAQQPTSTVSTNTTSTSVTGFGGFQDAGTKIKVKPQIADGDRLVLTYNVELSSFTSKPEGGLPGAKQQNTVTSVATIPDGHTIVVGGIELTTETDDESRVPLLGSIPLLGEFFKSHSTTRDRTRFFVFIRANVMREAQFEDLKYVSTQRAESLGVAEGSVGHGAAVETGWPKVEPKIIK